MHGNADLDGHLVQSMDIRSCVEVRKGGIAAGVSFMLYPRDTAAQEEAISTNQSIPFILYSSPYPSVSRTPAGLLPSPRQSKQVSKSFPLQYPDHRNAAPMPPLANATQPHPTPPTPQRLDFLPLQTSPRDPRTVCAVPPPPVPRSSGPIPRPSDPSPETSTHRPPQPTV